MSAFNPLDTVALTEVVELNLRRTAPTPLVDIAREAVSGCGLYALYYRGEFRCSTVESPTARPYAPISEFDGFWPIYLGSALPSGSRTGKVKNSGKSPIFERLDRHRQSVTQAENLDETEFFAHWLEVDEPFIILGEILLLRRFRPLWNSSVAGFGSKVVGGRRTGGRKSKWDTLHPGRSGVGQDVVFAIDQIVAEISGHLEAYPPGFASTAEMLAEN